MFISHCSICFFFFGYLLVDFMRTLNANIVHNKKVNNNIFFFFRIFHLLIRYTSHTIDANVFHCDFVSGNTTQIHS